METFQNFFIVILGVFALIGVASIAIVIGKSADEKKEHQQYCDSLIGKRQTTRSKYDIGQTGTTTLEIIDHPTQEDIIRYLKECI